MKLNQNDVAMLLVIVNSTPWTKTDMAKLVFKQLDVVREEISKELSDLVSKYEVEVEKTVEDGSKTTVKEVPEDKSDEVSMKMYNTTVDVDFGMLFAIVKKVVLDFPEMVMNKNGQKGIIGRERIEAYEDLKSKFIAND